MSTDLAERPDLVVATPSVSKSRTRSIPYRPGMDGLRALAVGAVVAYHINPRWLKGGFFGVDVFFVISGYLITSLLVRELSNSSTINLRNFWTGRARRLLPALGVMLAVCVLLSALFARDAMSELRTDVPAAAGYVTNWWMIFHHQSYFEAVGRPPLLLHLWSLAVEEQFYLLWPLVLLALVRCRVSLRTVGYLALGGAVVSSALMAGLYRPFTDPSRIYFGTDTHAQGLLIGCAVAIAVPPWRMTRSRHRSARVTLDLGMVLALGLLAWCMLTLGQYSAVTYRIGFVLVDTVAAVLVIGVMHPGCGLGTVLGRQPFRWIGTRSYAIYLWHWPILMLTRPDQDVAFAGWPLLVLRLVLICTAAELSYRFVEAPWRARTRDRTATATSWRRPKWPIVVGAVGSVAIVLTLVAVPSPAGRGVLAAGSTAAARAPITPPSSPPVTNPPPSASAVVSKTLSPGPAVPVSPTGVFPRAAPHSAIRLVPTVTSVPTTVPRPPVSASEILRGHEPILAIGDSVLLASAPALTATFGPEITVDAQVGRQVSAGIARLLAYRASGRLATYHTVMIDLGTNGPLTPALFAQLAAVTAGVANVVVYNVRMDRAWEPVTNGTLARQVATQPNMHLVNWYAASTAPGVLGPDEIHPTPAGGEFYAHLLLQTLVSLAPPHDRL